MTDSSDQSVKDELNKLLHDMEEDNESMDHSKKTSIAHQGASNFVSTVFRLSLFGLICLGIGYWVGSSTARILQPQSSLSGDQLMSGQQGWRAEGSGVFYRWCWGECHAPRLYGGGVSQVFEVKCVDRPCGDIHMKFNVLDAKGNVIDVISRNESGLQGEMRRFIIESQNPGAASIELSEFKAIARV